MISWEYGIKDPDPPLADFNTSTDWENQNLLSVIIMRNPIDRLLAGDGWISKYYPAILKGNATREEWRQYMNTSRGNKNTNNYALRTLAGKGCCDGAETNRKHLDVAKGLISRFSIVLDIACLNEGLDALADLLNITVTQKGRKSRKHKDAKARIGNDDVYDFLVERNKLDIELFDWSKSLSLVDCSQVV
jgi:hypothetical protein